MKGQQRPGRPLPRVSVVIPVKDDARKLRQCLAALARQDVVAHEVIVVDNASSDDSASVAHAGGARVIAEPRVGIGIASAAGYDQTRCEVIARLDADSLPGPGWVAAVARQFAADSELDAVTGPARFNDGPAVLRRPAIFVYLVPYFVLTSLALGHAPLFGSNMAFRQSAWREVREGLHLEDWLVHDDVDLSFHLGIGHSVRFCPSIVVGISMRPFSDGGGLLRLRRGFHTIFLHWPDETPWRRIARRVRRGTRRWAGPRVG
ncbi:glycosyltransferase family 2 protein [Micrococcaceae bacterium RIT802]|nr:glycosyltransferase family 2 protein [Micrococcaceae bacterium RIT 802]